jgi:hypothetical protein
VAVVRVSGSLDRKAIIEPERPDRQIEPEADAEIGSKATEGSTRPASV